MTPTPWWNHYCEAAWKNKATHWQRNDTVSLTANSIYSQAVQDYIKEEL